MSNGSEPVATLHACGCFFAPLQCLDNKTVIAAEVDDNCYNPICTNSRHVRDAIQTHAKSLQYLVYGRKLWNTNTQLLFPNLLQLHITGGNVDEVADAHRLAQHSQLHILYIPCPFTIAHADMLRTSGMRQSLVSLMTEIEDINSFDKLVLALPTFQSLRWLQCRAPLAPFRPHWSAAIQTCTLVEWRVTFSEHGLPPKECFSFRSHSVLQSIIDWTNAWARHANRADATLTTFQFGWQHCLQYVVAKRPQQFHMWLIQRLLVRLGQPGSSIRVLLSAPLFLLEWLHRQQPQFLHTTSWIYAYEQRFVAEGLKWVNVHSEKTHATSTDAWMRVAVVSAFVHAQPHHPFRDSIVTSRILAAILAFAAGCSGCITFQTSMPFHYTHDEEAYPLLYDTMRKLHTIPLSKWLDSALCESVVIN